MLSRAILLISTVAFSQLVFSACSPEFIENVSRALGYSSPENTTNMYVDCKAHPAIEHASIVAIASEQLHIPNAGDENFNLDISLVDTKSEEVLAHRLYEAKIQNGGGPKLTSIEIDTARYFVSPNSRAFGIRASFYMGFTSNQELSLFLFHDKDVVNILSGAEMQIFFTNRGASCAQQTREAARILVIDKKLTNGFYDLLVKEQLTDSEERIDQMGECKLVPINKETEQYRLQYDGTQYVIPNEMRFFDCRVC